MAVMKYIKPIILCAAAVTLVGCCFTANAILKPKVVAASSKVVATSSVSSQEVSSSEVSSLSSSSEESSSAIEKEPDKKATSEEQKKVLKKVKEKAPAKTTKSTSPSPSHVRTPVASGKRVLSGNGAVIDISNCSKGYIMAKCTGTSKRLKFQVKTSSKTYNYDLNNKGNYEVFPLQMGSKNYTVRVMENVGGSSYRQLFGDNFDVKLESSLLCFLYPNQFVNFSSSSAAVRKASQVCAGCSNDVDKLNAIYSFMTSEIKYDYAKASSVKSGYIPDVDEVLAKKKGICFDYSALMAAMLRSQDIPTQLICGSAGAVAQNHAWNEVYIKGTGWITVKIKNSSEGWQLLDPTFGEKTGNTSAYAAARVY